MAKLSLSFTPYSRRDPVSEETGEFLRKAGSRQTSAKLKEFQKCVGEKMRGFKAEGTNSKERSESIRKKFSSVAISCKAER